METYQIFAIAGMIVIMAVFFPVISELSSGRGIEGIKQGLRQGKLGIGSVKKNDPIVVMAVGGFFLALGINNREATTTFAGLVLLSIGGLRKWLRRPPTSGGGGTPPKDRPPGGAEPPGGNQPTKPGDTI